MKEWFKHQYGYVNIYENNLFFTNTGNWSETKDLKEKSDKQVKYKVKKYKVIVFMTMVFMLFAFSFFSNIISDKLSLLILIGLPVAGYFFYKYMHTELGPCYRIPLSKISNIVIDDKKVTVSFINEQGKLDSEILGNIEGKGLQILAKLKSDNLY